MNIFRTGTSYGCANRKIKPKSSKNIDKTENESLIKYHEKVLNIYEKYYRGNMRFENKTNKVAIELIKLENTYK